MKKLIISLILATIGFIMLVRGVGASTSEHDRVWWENYCSSNPSICTKVNSKPWNQYYYDVLCPSSTQVPDVVAVSASYWNNTVYILPENGYGISYGEYNVAVWRSDYGNIPWVILTCKTKSTPTPIATPTVAPTATPTVMPTATPTVEPTATPTEGPTATPSATPTETPTGSPEPTVTPEPYVAPGLTAAGTPDSYPGCQGETQPMIIHAIAKRVGTNAIVSYWPTVVGGEVQIRYRELGVTDWVNAHALRDFPNIGIAPIGFLKEGVSYEYQLINGSGCSQSPWSRLFKPM